MSREDVLRGAALQAGINIDNQNQEEHQEEIVDVEGGAQPNLLISASEVSNIVKAGVAEAIGSFQQHFDSILNDRKEESQKALLQVQNLKKSSEVSFRFKGNRTQYQFNEQIAKKLEI